MTPERGGYRRISWAFAVLGAAQLGVAGWFLTAGTPVLLVFGELLIVALGTMVLGYARYLRFRRSYELALAGWARDQERGGLAEELHDVLGHELSLIALRAAALQVTSTGAAAEQAAAVRGQVEEAVLQLRQIVQLLRPTGDVAEVAQPAGWDLAALVDRAREAGAAIAVDGGLDDLPAPVRLTAYRVVQECVTNAAKHSPGAPIDIGFRSAGGALVVTVRTTGDAAEDAGSWSGLERLQRRLRALNGELSVRGVDGSRETRARIPFASAPAGRATPAGTAAPVRRPGAATLRWVLPPVVGITSVVAAYYTWATYAADIEQDRFDRLTVGQPVAAAEDGLPEREAPVRVIPTDPVPPAWRCRYFTDGNFLLGMATFEVCDDGTALTRVRDLRRQPWS